MEETIDNIRKELDYVQSHLVATSSDVMLQETKRDYTHKLKKFLGIQEGALKQKSRIQWLQTRDSNSKIFFTAIKERHSRNSIDIIYDSTGQKLTTSNEIKLR